MSLTFQITKKERTKSREGYTARIRNQCSVDVIEHSQKSKEMLNIYQQTAQWVTLTKRKSNNKYMKFYT